MDASQIQNQVNEGVFDKDDKRRKLMAEIKETVTAKKDGNGNKKELLQKLNLFTAIELEKTKAELQKEGLAVRKDQSKREKNKV